MRTESYIATSTNLRLPPFIHRTRRGEPSFDCSTSASAPSLLSPPPIALERKNNHAALETHATRSTQTPNTQTALDLPPASDPNLHPHLSLRHASSHPLLRPWHVRTHATRLRARPAAALPMVLETTCACAHIARVAQAVRRGTMATAYDAVA